MQRIATLLATVLLATAGHLALAAPSQAIGTGACESGDIGYPGIAEREPWIDRNANFQEDPDEDTGICI